ncbi:MAG: hypothetical protein WC897_01715 [Candidatus Gracilibacteria bacterium]
MTSYRRRGEELKPLWKEADKEGARECIDACRFDAGLISLQKEVKTHIWDVLDGLERIYLDYEEKILQEPEDPTISQSDLDILLEKYKEELSDHTKPSDVIEAPYEQLYQEVKVQYDEGEREPNATRIFASNYNQERISPPYSHYHQEDRHDKDRNLKRRTSYRRRDGELELLYAEAIREGAREEHERENFDRKFEEQENPILLAKKSVQAWTTDGEEKDTATLWEEEGLRGFLSRDELRAQDKEWRGGDTEDDEEEDPEERWNEDFDELSEDYTPDDDDEEDDGQEASL